MPSEIYIVRYQEKKFKREIGALAGMRTRIAPVVERRARNPEVRGSNPGSGSYFFLDI